MKTFGDLKVRDKVYSLNYKDWGVLTEHTVSGVKRKEHLTAIKVKDYLKHQLIGGISDDEADLTLIKNNKCAIGEVAPSIEGVKKYWIKENY